MTNGNGDASKAAPVYVPYATVISALDALRQHGIPGTGKIDKTVWDSQSGAIQGQLIVGFKFLGLIDEQRRVQPGLSPLVDASPEARKPLLKKIIEDKYRDVLARDLSTITQGQLAEAFRTFDISGSTLDRAIRFFVRACTELGIPISKRISAKSRVSSGTRKPRRTNGTKRQEENAASFTHSNDHHSGTWEEKLLEKFPQFDPSWTDDLKAKWFEGFDRLMGAKPE